MPRPRKRFGQHWLKDTSVHRAMVAAAGLDLEVMAGRAPLPENPPCILEIGSGTGKLTRKLLAAGADVIGFEVDRKLSSILRKNLGHEKRFTLIQSDFLRSPLPPEPTHVVANIPYNITSPILEKVLGSPEAPVTQFDSIILLVQKELADRLSAEPGTKAFGAMTVRCQYLADCETLRIVSPQAFQPPPKVDSAIIRLQPRVIATPAQDPHRLAVLVRQGFMSRRKTLANTLQSLVAKKGIYEALETIGCDRNSRAEALSVEQWIALSDALPSQQSIVNSASIPSEDNDPSDGGQAKPDELADAAEMAVSLDNQ